MYKTVRHGENSLQYTILPQTEEVLNNSGVKGKGRDYSPSIHVRRSRRRSTAKYVVLVTFGLMVALMLAAIPICVMNGTLYARRGPPDHHDITSPPLTPTGREIVKSRKKELKITPEIESTLKSKSQASTSTTISHPTSAASTVAAAVPKEAATTPPWSMPALRAWRSSTTSSSEPPTTDSRRVVPASAPSSGTVPLLDRMSLRPWPKDIIIKPTVTPETVTMLIFRYGDRSLLPSEKSLTQKALATTKGTTRQPVTTETTSDRSKMSDLKDAILSIDDDDDFKESLEVDEVFSLPPMKPESVGPRDGDDVTVAKAGDAGWYGARWPFVDTSSYFQWTGYSPGDNLLLPLLVAALSSVALVLMLALAVRRRKRSQLASSNIGLSTDLQADDNTNLLADVPEDPEE